MEYSLSFKITKIIECSNSPEVMHALKPYELFIRDERSMHNWTFLHDSVLIQKLHAIRACLKFGIDVNARTDYGDTPLHMACRVKKAKSEVVQELLNAGADLTAKDGSGMTPIQYARENKLLGLVTILENEPARRRWARRSDWLATVVMASAHPKD